jgi:hypothetical protein
MAGCSTTDVVAPDAAAAKAGSSDAGAADADSSVPSPGFFCCNANPDPCCEYLFCDAALSPACACELLDAGAPTIEPDGGPGCTSPEAGPK